MKSTFWMTAQETEDELRRRGIPRLVSVERRSAYQGVPQYGITGCAESTPSRATAEKWARLENAARLRK